MTAWATCLAFASGILADVTRAEALNLLVSFVDLVCSCDLAWEHTWVFSAPSMQAPDQAYLGQSWTHSQPGAKPSQPTAWSRTAQLSPATTSLLVAKTRSMCMSVSPWGVGWSVPGQCVSLYVFLSFVLILIHKSPKEWWPPFRGEGRERNMLEQSQNLH